MQKRIFRGALLLTLATALVIGLLSTAVYYHWSGEQLEGQLWQELDMLSTLLKQAADQDAEEAALKALHMPNRLTWIAPDGTCLLYTSPSPRDRSVSRMPSSA